MIGILLNDTAYEQDIRELLMAFYPGETFVHEKQDDVDFYVEGTCSQNADETKFGLKITDPAGTVADEAVFPIDYDVRLNAKTTIKKELYGMLKKRTGKEAYCLFIAPTINKACLAHFFALNKIGISYYGGKTKIIPLELDQFMRLVENSYNYHTQPAPHNIRQFLDEVMRQEELATDENDWNDKIQNCVAQWLAA